jgi:hypothetical protein
MVVSPGSGTAVNDGSAGMIHVTATLRGLGAELGMLVAEDPARLQEFLQETQLHDQAYKRWQYVRGVRQVPGAGANVVGRLPPDLPYTGFEGYWAGSGQSEEDTIADEVAMGDDLVLALARLAGVEHAWRAGLDIAQNPHAERLLQAALGQHYRLGPLQQLEPIFGELLARLRAQAETGSSFEAYSGFQADVDAAVRMLTPSVYSDPSRHFSLSDLARSGRNVEGRDIEEQYDLPRVRVTNQHITTINLHGRERDSYWLMSEIGRLGHPLVRALLHISDWPTGGRLEFYAPLGSQQLPQTRSQGQDDTTRR